jgi:hypothetical protein
VTAGVVADSAIGRQAGARVVIRAKGVSQDKDGQIGIGIVLKNTSRTLDAVDADVTINALAASGRIVATSSSKIPVIPANTVFYYGDGTYAHGSLRAVKLEAFVTVGQSVRHIYHLPLIRHLAIERVQYFGVQVHGELTNTLHQPLSVLARIGIVLFDRAGHVVGGGFAFPDAPVPPHRTILFDAVNGVNAAPEGKVAFGRASGNAGDFDPIQ